MYFCLLQLFLLLYSHYILLLSIGNFYDALEPYDYPHLVIKQPEKKYMDFR
jgi:hypothetical protein